MTTSPYLRRLLSATIVTVGALALGATALAAPGAAAAKPARPAAKKAAKATPVKPSPAKTKAKAKPTTAKPATATKGAPAQTTPATAKPTASATTSTAVGLLAPTDAQASALQGSTVTRVTVSAGWDQLEPSNGSYNTTLLAALAARIQSLRNAGFQVVLDLGLQYPPSWVFALPGQTRFVDQYGDTWQAGLSEDVPNAVFNQAVRAAEADYLTHLGAALGTANLAAIRVGGLLSGELRYPNASYAGHSDLIWDYDDAAQANAPYPGWRPGSGTATQIRASLDYYFASLTNYESWLMSSVGAAFSGVDQQVMLPGWGLRPGMVDDAVSTGMQNRSLAEVNGLISSGLDWADQVAAIRDSGQAATVYTTWLDAPAQSSTIQGVAPVDYLATLAGKYGLPLAGENTGGGGTSALATCVSRARADHLTSFMYMAGDLIADGRAGITLDDLVGAGAQLNS